MRVRAWLAESCSLVHKEQNLLGRICTEKIQNVYSFSFVSDFFVIPIIFFKFPETFS